MVVEQLACLAVAQQFSHPLVQLLIYRSPLILASSFRLLNSLSLTLATLLVILSSNRRHHLHQHRIDCAQHPAGEFVLLRVLHSLVASRQVERDDAQAL